MRYFRQLFSLRLPKTQARLGADRANPLLPEILAFWALWHCRHARPPDRPFAGC
ncbi:hypothetical protein H3H51_06675 [Pseudomonas sp. UL070]|uniref:Uncharacterized protein n=2 Tax=Aquipseudomonas ullengensis TaxID=2759166 RepID=A0A7W4Q9I8_9GAMM|nr:hypothetical protein [Pseudomonas ullengensis]